MKKVIGSRGIKHLLRINFFLPLFLTLMLASCNEGGIVGTGEGDAELSDSTLDPSNGNDTPISEQPADQLPGKVFLPTPATLLKVNNAVEDSATEILQSGFQSREIRQLKIRLELLYLETAFAAVSNFCTDTLLDQTCILTGSTINLTHTAATAEAEFNLLQQINGSPVTSQMIAEKTGSPIPLGTLSFTRTTDTEFQYRLTSVRNDSEQGTIDLTFDWSSVTDSHRISYQTDSGTLGGSAQNIAILQFKTGNQQTERVASISPTTQEIFLLTALASSSDALHQFIQADWRSSTNGNYKHLSWDGQASNEGGFLQARLSTDPSMQQATSVSRSIIDEQGAVTATETCEDNNIASLCSSDSSSWQNLTEAIITDSALFLNDEALQSWKQQLDDTLPSNNITGPEIDSIVMAPLNHSPSAENLLFTATRNISAGVFRNYLLSASPAAEPMQSYRESLVNSSMEYTPVTIGGN